MKNMKMYTKLIISFIIIDILFIITLFTSYTTVASIVKLEAERQTTYLRNYTIYLVIMFIVLMVVMCVVSMILSRTIRTGMQGLIDVADALAAGDVSVTANVVSNDEFGTLMKDFQKVIANIRSDIEVAQAVAEGDMTVNVYPKSDQDALGNALKKMVESNQYALSGIRDAAYQVNTSSSQVASASEALAQGSTEQASAIEQVTASIDDVAERTKQNAEQANVAAGMMSRAIEDVKKGNKEMQEMGFQTIQGRIDTKFFYEHFYQTKDYERRNA